jgi:hypothetical protein
MSFAALESSLNSATLAAFSNASMVWLASTVPGVFDAFYADPLGMDNSSPNFLCLAAAVSGLVAGASVAVDAVAYIVREVRPERGLVRLILEAA